MLETKIVRPEADDKPELRHLVDVTIGELNQGSGELDENTGRELTNDEQIRDTAARLGAVDVMYTGNGLSSPEAKQANSELAQTPQPNAAQKAANFTVSALMVMPKKGL